MTWTSFHHRGEVLRDVIRTADERLDGALLMDLDGVRETFADELELLGALQLRWHTRLAGQIERQLMNQPMDLEDAVIAAWHHTADELPGIRAILDRQRQLPLDPQMAEKLAKSMAKEHLLLAVMAGRGNAEDPASVVVGARIEGRARATYVPAEVHKAAERPTLLTWLKAALAA